MTVGKHLWECHRAAKDLGRSLEICVVLGNHPGISLGSLYPGAFGVDEYDIIGGLIGKSLEIVPAKTVNIEVPASSELVIEGRYSQTNSMMRDHSVSLPVTWWTLPRNQLFE